MRLSLRLQCFILILPAPATRTLGTLDETLPSNYVHASM